MTCQRESAIRGFIGVFRGISELVIVPVVLTKVLKVRKVGRYYREMVEVVGDLPIHLYFYPQHKHI
jgi:dihydrodipicolinate synthase/N-acetylneuraminate lyase